MYLKPIEGRFSKNGANCCFQGNKSKSALVFRFTLIRMTDLKTDLWYDPTRAQGRKIFGRHTYPKAVADINFEN